MFEQSILANVSAASKTRALAVSFGMQTMVIVAVVAVPLFFADRLPRVPLFTPLAVPAPISDPPPQTQSYATQVTKSKSAMQTPRIFSDAIFRRPSVSTGPVVLNDAGPMAIDNVGFGPAVIGPVGSPFPVSDPVAVAPAHVAPVPAKKTEKPIRVVSEMQASKLIHKVVPLYPEIAKRARISGTVQLTGVIAKNGTIEHLELISGNPLLVPAAMAAVKQWIYSPTFLNGEPVEVIAPIDVIFRLSQ
jgi:protein TonB